MKNINFIFRCINNQHIKSILNICQPVSQLPSVLRSCWMMAASVGVLISQYKTQFSANSQTLDQCPLGRSSKQNSKNSKNQTGPRVLPWDLLTIHQPSGCLLWDSRKTWIHHCVCPFDAIIVDLPQKTVAPCQKLS